MVMMEAISESDYNQIDLNSDDDAPDDYINDYRHVHFDLQFMLKWKSLGPVRDSKIEIRDYVEVEYELDGQTRNWKGYIGPTCPADLPVGIYLSLFVMCKEDCLSLHVVDVIGGHTALDCPENRSYAYAIANVPDLDRSVRASWNEIDNTQRLADLKSFYSQSGSSEEVAKWLTDWKGAKFTQISKLIRRAEKQKRMTNVYDDQLTFSEKLEIVSHIPRSQYTFGGTELPVPNNFPKSGKMNPELGFWITMFVCLSTEEESRTRLLKHVQESQYKHTNGHIFGEIDEDTYIYGGPFTPEIEIHFRYIHKNVFSTIQRTLCHIKSGQLILSDDILIYLRDVNPRYQLKRGGGVHISELSYDVVATPPYRVKGKLHCSGTDWIITRYLNTDQPVFNIQHVVGTLIKGKLEVVDKFPDPKKFEIYFKIGKLRCCLPHFLVHMDSKSCLVPNVLVDLARVNGSKFSIEDLRGMSQEAVIKPAESRPQGYKHYGDTQQVWDKLIAEAPITYKECLISYRSENDDKFREGTWSDVLSDDMYRIKYETMEYIVTPYDDFEDNLSDNNSLLVEIFTHLYNIPELLATSRFSVLYKEVVEVIRLIEDLIESPSIPRSSPGNVYLKYRSADREVPQNMEKPIKLAYKLGLLGLAMLMLKVPQLFKSQEIIGHFEKTLRVVDDIGDVVNVLTLMYVEMGKYVQADKLLQGAASIPPPDKLALRKYIRETRGGDREKIAIVYKAMMSR